MAQRGVDDRRDGCRRERAIKADHYREQRGRRGRFGVVVVGGGDELEGAGK